MEDDEALGRVRAGELDAFRFVVARHHRALYYFVVGKMTVDGEVEDIVQKTFVTAYRNLAEYQRDQPLFPWLRGIALNHCRNEWKRFRRSAAASGSLLDQQLSDAELATTERTPVPGDADDDAVRVSALRSCLARLTEQQRRLLALRFVEERPLGEIGHEVGRSGEAVRLALFRLRLRLAACVRRRLAHAAELA